MSEAHQELMMRANEIARQANIDPSVFNETELTLARAFAHCARAEILATQNADYLSIDARVGKQLIAILSNYCGERGDNEGAVETLERIIRERNMQRGQGYQPISTGVGDPLPPPRKP